MNLWAQLLKQIAKRILWQEDLLFLLIFLNLMILIFKKIIIINSLSLRSPTFSPQSGGNANPTILRIDTNLKIQNMPIIVCYFTLRIFFLLIKVGIIILNE